MHCSFLSYEVLTAHVENCQLFLNSLKIDSRSLYTIADPGFNSASPDIKRLSELSGFFCGTKKSIRDIPK